MEQGSPAVKSRHYLPSATRATYSVLLQYHKGSTDDFNGKVTHFFKTMFSMAVHKASGLLIIAA